MNNYKLFTDEDILLITTSKVVSEQNGLEDIRSMEIQVDWASLTGTLDAQVKISQRTESSMNYLCRQDNEANPNPMIKTLDSASGTYVFTIDNFYSKDLKVEIIKNNCTGGIVNGAIGVRYN